MKRIVLIAMVILSAMATRAEITLEQCLQLAEENYPLIKKYKLIEATADLDLDDINRGWLPRINAYAQGTVQNVVPSFPSTLSNMMQQMGSEVEGLGKMQYRLGIDVQQTIWDGGASRAQREFVRRRSDVEAAAVDVDLYSVRRRVQNCYFGIMLLHSQIEQMQGTIQVVESNLQMLRSMLANGVCMQSDVDQTEAQLLTLQQSLIGAKGSEDAYRQMLGLFVGRNVENEALIEPNSEIPADLTSDRPELRLFDSKIALANAQKSLTDVSVMPKIGFFAQTYYGYPGIDYFKAMMDRTPSLNLIAGVKVSWGIDSFYTRKSNRQAIDVANDQTDIDRATFLFNSQIQTISCLREIESIRNVMSDDVRIVELRRNVRKAAESMLRNGVIDATALLTKINDENQASLAATYHKIQYLHAIYNLKNDLNK